MTCRFTMSTLVFELAAAIVEAQLAKQLHPKADNKMKEYTWRKASQELLFFMAMTEREKSQQIFDSDSLHFGPDTGRLQHSNKDNFFSCSRSVNAKQ